VTDSQRRWVPLESLQGWRARYGDLFTVRFPVVGTGVYVADPGAIRTLFTVREPRRKRRSAEGSRRDGRLAS
jgi:cytochrome P450